MASIDDRLREIAALNSQQRQALTTAAAASSPEGSTRDMAFAVASKVLDLVTGQTGVVIDGYRVNEVVSPASNQSH